MLTRQEFGQLMLAIGGMHTLNCGGDLLVSQAQVLRLLAAYTDGIPTITIEPGEHSTSIRWAFADKETTP